MVRGLGIASSKFYDWRERYGKVNEHNAQVPRDHWLEDWEKAAILGFDEQYPLEGYRRQAFMLLGSGHRGGEPVERVSRVEEGGPAGSLESQAVTARGRASFIRSGPMSIGTWTYHTSMFAVTFLLPVLAFWTATVDPSFIGRFANR